VTTTTTQPTPLSDDVRVIGWVSVAHGFSHFFQLVLPPVFPLVKETFDTSYASLGLVVSVYYVVSGLLQTVAGFAVDRFGPRAMLLFGLVCAATGALVAGLSTGLPMLFVAAVIGGVANSVFHPADLALLNAKVDTKRLGYAFSFHQVGGSVGYVLAPIFSVAIAQMWGWRTALLVAAAIGIAFALVAMLQGSLRLQRPVARKDAGGDPQAAARLLRSAPVIHGFAFFTLVSVALVGYMTFTPTAIAQLNALPMVTAAGFLTAFMIGTIVGTLAGGVAVSHSARHGTWALIALLGAAVLSVLVGTGSAPNATLWPLAFVTGTLMGFMNPSRDVLVREMAPPEHRGKVYGLVYSGLDAGAGIAGPVFGWLLDHGRPGWTFYAGAFCILVSLPSLFGMRIRSQSV
jgi:MFS family permease